MPIHSSSVRLLKLYRVVSAVFSVASRTKLTTALDTRKLTASGSSRETLAKKKPRRSGAEV
jgi:hypothetical protein